MQMMMVITQSQIFLKLLQGDQWLVQSWARSVFFNYFNNKKLIFCIFYQVNLTGSGIFK